ncbi:unnamed protein product, partial [Mesorhabditis spiculigera]
MPQRHFDFTYTDEEGDCITTNSSSPRQYFELLYWLKKQPSRTLSITTSIAPLNRALEIRNWAGHRALSPFDFPEPDNTQERFMDLLRRLELKQENVKEAAERTLANQQRILDSYRQPSSSPATTVSSSPTLPEMSPPQPFEMPLNAEWTRFQNEAKESLMEIQQLKKLPSPIGPPKKTTRLTMVHSETLSVNGNEWKRHEAVQTSDVATCAGICSDIWPWTKQMSPVKEPLPAVVLERLKKPFHTRGLVVKKRETGCYTNGILKRVRLERRKEAEQAAEREKAAALVVEMSANTEQQQQQQSKSISEQLGEIRIGIVKECRSKIAPAPNDENDTKMETFSKSFRMVNLSNEELANIKLRLFRKSNGVRDTMGDRAIEFEPNEMCKIRIGMRVPMERYENFFVSYVMENTDGQVISPYIHLLAYANMKPVQQMNIVAQPETSCARVRPFTKDQIPPNSSPAKEEISPEEKMIELLEMKQLKIEVAEQTPEEKKRAEEQASWDALSPRSQEEILSVIRHHSRPSSEPEPEPVNPTKRTAYSLAEYAIAPHRFVHNRRRPQVVTTTTVVPMPAPIVKPEAKPEAAKVEAVKPAAVVVKPVEPVDEEVNAIIDRAINEHMLIDNSLEGDEEERNARDARDALAAMEAILAQFRIQDQAQIEIQRGINDSKATGVQSLVSIAQNVAKKVHPVEVIESLEYRHYEPQQEKASEEQQNTADNETTEDDETEEDDYTYESEAEDEAEEPAVETSFESVPPQAAQIIVEEVADDVEEDEEEDVLDRQSEVFRAPVLTESEFELYSTDVTQGDQSDVDSETGSLDSSYSMPRSSEGGVDSDDDSEFEVVGRCPGGLVADSAEEAWAWGALRLNTSDEMDMMKMWLHFGEREKILFSWWKTGTAAGLLLSVVIIFLLCIFHEAIKGLRYFIAIQHENERRNERQERLNRPSPPTGTPPDNVSERSVLFSPLLRFSGTTRRLFTRYRIAQALLYGVQIVLSYMLMLIVMTFNVWLILAVVIGEAVGYFLFTGSPVIDDGVGDCC